MPETRLIAIGGGELRTRETIEIDEYIATEAKKIAGDRRACGLFLPTASADCMPYYNTFHKVYTGVFNVKTDVLLTIGREIDLEKWQGKLEKADFIYVGGGNTVAMLEQWKKVGLLPLIKNFYESGKLVTGLSAGAICWFEKMYSDSVVEGEYHIFDGLGWIKGKISPHYDERMLDFDEIILYNRIRAWGLENNSAMEFRNGQPVKTIGGGNVFELDGTDGREVRKTKIVL